MKRIDSLPTKLYRSEDLAFANAWNLSAGDEDGWSYDVVPNPHGSEGYAIKITDDSGHFVAYWSE